MVQIRGVYKQAWGKLAESDSPAAHSDEAGWASVQAEGQDRSMPAQTSELSLILNLEAAVGRSQAASKVSLHPYIILIILISS